MKKVLDTYSSKNDVNIKQIVAYKDNILEMEEYMKVFLNHLAIPQLFVII